jgi:hypothetical protein
MVGEGFALTWFMCELFKNGFYIEKDKILDQDSMKYILLGQMKNSHLIFQTLLSVRPCGFKNALYDYNVTCPGYQGKCVNKVKYCRKYLRSVLVP